MIPTNRKLHYFGIGSLLLLIALAVLGLSLLFMNRQSVSAQEETNTEQPGTDTQNTENTEPDPNLGEFFTFEETDTSLTLTVDASVENLLLKLQMPLDGSTDEGNTESTENNQEENTMTGLDLPRQEGADNKPVWQYVGPSSLVTSDCHSRAWEEDFASSHQTVVATLADDNQADQPVKASLKINLREDSSNQTWYCFRIPVVIRPVEAIPSATPPVVTAEGEEQFRYKSYTLTKEAPEVVVNQFTFRNPPSQAGNQLPPSVIVEVPEGAAVDLNSWQYVKVESADQCSADNAELDFTDSTPAATNNTVPLISEDQGTIYCFRVATTDGAEATHLYDTYNVPNAPAAVGTDPANTGTSSNRIWIALGVIIGIAVAGGVIYFVKARADKK